jgi:hypothetical protein
VEEGREIYNTFKQKRKRKEKEKERKSIREHYTVLMRYHDIYIYEYVYTYRYY